MKRRFLFSAVSMSLLGSLSAALVGVLLVGQAAFGSTYIGNTLQNNGSTDGDPPLVILGEYNAVAPTATSTVNFPRPGIVTAVQTYDTSAGQNFNVYLCNLLEPTATAISNSRCSMTAAC